MEYQRNFCRYELRDVSTGQEKGTFFELMMKEIETFSKSETLKSNYDLFFAIGGQIEARLKNRFSGSLSGQETRELTEALDFE
jgi:hypothetical protein